MRSRLGRWLGVKVGLFTDARQGFFFTDATSAINATDQIMGFVGFRSRAFPRVVMVVVVCARVCCMCCMC